MAKLTGNDEGRATILQLGHSVDITMTCAEELHYGLEPLFKGHTMQWINTRFRDANGVCKSSRVAIR